MFWLPAEPVFLSRGANNTTQHRQQFGARGVIFVGSAGVVHVMFFRAFIKEFIKEFSLPAEAVGVGCHFRPAVGGLAGVWGLFRISVSTGDSTHKFH